MRDLWSPLYRMCPVILSSESLIPSLLCLFVSLLSQSTRGSGGCYTMAASGLQHISVPLQQEPVDHTLLKISVISTYMASM